MKNNQKSKLLKEFNKQKILKLINKENLLIYAFLYNKREEINLNNEQISFLIKNTDLKNSVENGWNALMILMETNLSQEINITSEQLDYLIYNSDIAHSNKLKETVLMLLFQLNQNNKININKKQLDYLIEHSNLSAISEFGFNTLFYALGTSEAEKIKLSKKQWLKIINGSVCDGRIWADSIYIYLAEMAMDWRKEKILRILKNDKQLISYINENERLNEEVKNKILSEIDNLIIDTEVNNSSKKINNKI